MRKIEPEQALRRLLDIMSVLRSPAGCPWDAVQTPETLQPYLLEETYEVLQALDGESPEAVCEELGDLLLQIVFLARIFEERGAFDMGDVADSIAEKMERRHPHVFGTAPTGDLASLDAQWERIKNAEKRQEPQRRSLFASVPREMPALLRATKIAEKASRAGLLPAGSTTASSLSERVSRFEQSVRDPDATRDAVGELLYAIVETSRTAGIDPEGALRQHLDRMIEELEVKTARKGGDRKDCPPELDES